MTRTALTAPIYQIAAPDKAADLEAFWRKLTYDLFFLDAAIESGDITGDQYTFLNGFCPELVTRDLIDPDPLSSTLDDTLGVLNDAYLAWRETLPTLHRLALSRMAFDTIRYRLQEDLDEATGMVAHSLIESGVSPAQAGCAEIDCAIRALQAGAGPLIGPGLQSHLDRSIRLLSTDLTCAGARRVASSQIDTACSELTRISRQRRDELDRLLLDLSLRLPERDRGAPTPVLTRQANTADVKRVRKQRRKVVTKALRLVDTILGRDAATLFVRGDELILEGRRFNFSVRRKSLFAIGHGGLSISVTDKNHVLLVDLCFYFDETPAPDQLAALALHVKAGAEDEILKTANVIQYHPAAHASADLRDARGGRGELQAVAWEQGGMQFKQALEPYRAAILPILCDAVIDQALQSLDATLAARIRSHISLAPAMNIDRAA